MAPNLGRFNRLPDTIEKLHGHERISDATKGNLEDHHERLSSRLNRSRGDLRQGAVQAYARMATEFTAAVEVIDDGHHNQDRTTHEACLEAAEITGGYDAVEVFILPGLKDSPRVYPLRGPDGLTLLIFESLAVDMREVPHVGLFYHEVAHGEPFVYQFCCESKSSERWKKGEVLADLCALALSGPLYASAVPRYLDEIGRDPQATGRSHPSFAMRVDALKDTCSDIWTGELVSEILNHLKPVEGPVPAEDQGLRVAIQTDIIEFLPDLRNYKIPSDLIYQARQGGDVGSPRVELAAAVPN